LAPPLTAKTKDGALITDEPQADQEAVAVLIDVRRRVSDVFIVEGVLASGPGRRCWFML
jgi:hypothetical protein